MKIAVLFHNDADGFGSAFAAWVSLREKHELIFEPAQYGELPPYQKLHEFRPDQIYILDFSYKAPVLREFMRFLPNTVVIDHHKTSVEELADFPEIEVSGFHEVDGVQTPLFSGVRVFQENSGCVLSWLFFNPNDEIPELLHYVQDRDLWKFELEHSKEINAYIATLPLDFEVWADFYMPLAYDAGKAVLAFQGEQIRKRVEGAEMVRFLSYSSSPSSRPKVSSPIRSRSFEKSKAPVNPISMWRNEASRRNSTCVIAPAPDDATAARLGLIASYARIP